MAATRIVLWELHSESDGPARCAYDRTPDAPHLVTVTVGDTELISEEVDSEGAALDEALYLLDDFAFRGWTIVIYRDPRLNQGSSGSSGSSEAAP